MSFRAKMHPQVSKAEIMVLKELSRLGLTLNMVTQKPIVLKMTIPDFMWCSKRKVVYLDGSAVHRGKQLDLDAEINAQLEMQGWQVLRIPYDAPMSKAALKNAMALIKEFLGEMS